MATAWAAGSTVDHLTTRRPQYSVGFSLSEATAAAVDLIPAHVWTPAYDTDGAELKPCDGAWLAELTGLIDLTEWPPGMRVSDGVRHIGHAGEPGWHVSS